MEPESYTAWALGFQPWRQEGIGEKGKHTSYLTQFLSRPIADQIVRKSPPFFVKVCTTASPVISCLSVLAVLTSDSTFADRTQ